MVVSELLESLKEAGPNLEVVVVSKESELSSTVLQAGVLQEEDGEEAFFIITSEAE